MRVKPDLARSQSRKLRVLTIVFLDRDQTVSQLERRSRRAGADRYPVRGRSQRGDPLPRSTGNRRKCVSEHGSDRTGNQSCASLS
jgi:hypothetical protein